MEEASIAFTGLTRAAADTDCADGELSIAYNVAIDGGAMRPFALPPARFQMGEGERLLAVHNAGNQKNYLYAAPDGTLRAFRMEDGARTDYALRWDMRGETVAQVQVVGNTVVVATDGGLRYFLWKETDYAYLGDHLPQCTVSFGLRAYPGLFSELEGEEEREYTIDAKGRMIDDGIKPTLEVPEDERADFTTAVMALVNEYTNRAATRRGRFLQPFFVRCALRLFDGSLACHSAPVLMVPATEAAPVVFVTSYGTGDGGEARLKLDVYGTPCALDWQMPAGAGWKDDWKDIVRGIDIFVSVPLYTYDTGGTCQTIRCLGRRNQPASPGGFLVGKAARDTADGTRPWPDGGGLTRYYQKWDTGTLYAAFYGKAHPDKTVELPAKGDFEKSVRQCSVFYLLKSVRLEDLPEDIATVPKPVDVAEDYLASLALKEPMTDDYQGNDRLVPGYVFAYNQRLNLADLRRELFEGYDSAALCCRCDGHMDYDPATGAWDETGTGITPITCRTTIVEDGKEIVVEGGAARFYNTSFGLYLYYPNPNATRMTVRAGAEPLAFFLDVKLEEHEGLNGAYWFGGLKDFPAYGAGTFPATSADRLVAMPSKIYTSEAGNPFHFPFSGITTVGTGRVLGMGSTTRALSQGQFGQFPLLAFATDGIWALEVGATGLYTAVQPVSRDVCSNPASITPTDGSIAFVSDKGLMAVDGSEVLWLSSALDGPALRLDDVQRLAEVLSREGIVAGADVGGGDLRGFLSACQVAYDYPGARLLLFTEGGTNALLYSLTSGTWSTVEGGVLLRVSDYPGCLVQMADGSVRDISRKADYGGGQAAEAGEAVKTFLLTRPLKLGDLALKTVNAVVCRGAPPPSGGMAVVLFASHDGAAYVPVGSAVGTRLSRLQGSPYRYFRLALVAGMKAGEALPSTTVYFTRKWRNKPR